MPPRKQTPHYDVAAGVIWAGEPYRSRLLIAQRPPDGMLGGLWEFPGGKLEARTPICPPVCAARSTKNWRSKIEVGELLTVVKHAYTHFRITLHTFHASHVAGTPQTIGCQDWRWVELDDLASFPLPVTDQKIVAALHSAQPSPQSPSR
jgi:A/G-specific adenine glycosylase